MFEKEESPCLSADDEHTKESSRGLQPHLQHIPRNVQKWPPNLYDQDENDCTCQPHCHIHVLMEM